MIIEIDQSGKVEDTSVDTVIGAANKLYKRSVRIVARDKRKIQIVFRDAGKSGTFAYRVFAALIYLTIENDLSRIDEIVIDEEYTSKENLIHLFLRRYMRALQPQVRPPRISFQRVGRKSPAHDTAYHTFTQRRRADRVVSAAEILRLILHN